MAASVRYRYHGKFITEATARRYSNLKGASPYVTSERVKVGGRTTTARRSGYVPPEALQRKRPSIPPAPPTAPKPEAVPTPPPAPPPEAPRMPVAPPEPKRHRITPDERFQREADEWEELAGGFEEEPSRELWEEITHRKADLDERFESLEEPSDESSDRYESIEGQWEDLQEVAPGEYDFEEELFGYDRFEGEDQFIEDMEVLDLDTDEEYPEK